MQGEGMPTTIQALLIAVLVLSPGYIFIQIARRVIAYIEEPTDGRFFLTTIVAGTIIHACVFPWTVRLYRFFEAKTLLTNSWEVFIWALLTIFLLPLIFGIIIGKLSAVWWIDKLLEKVGMGYLDRLPSAWDGVVRQKAGQFVRIYLKDGRGVIGGVYSVNSIGSTNARRPDIYLEQQWEMDKDNDFVQPVPSSSGVWVAHDTMGYVEFMEGLDKPYERNNGHADVETGEEHPQPKERPVRPQG
jgi:hypothetical protein